jgi:hypothetical protein
MIARSRSLPTVARQDGPPPDVPWYVRAILVRPRAVLANLERVRAAGVLAEVPTPWQLSLAVLRMWHRLAFRRDTIGTSPGGRVRATWRARLFAPRALRLPVLLAHGAVVPLDFTGLGSSPERLIRHLLGAHHDGAQFAFDLEILAAHDKLDELVAAAEAVVTGADPHAAFLRDLTVFEGYHEALLAAARAAAAGRALLDGAEARDPDASFVACMTWCARAPRTPAATLAAWRAGAFRLDGGLGAAPQLHAGCDRRGSGAVDSPRTARSRSAWSSRTAPRMNPQDLVGMPRTELAAIAARGRRFDPEALAGWRFDGISLGLPRLVERLTWTKFGKEFARDARGLRGWNVRMVDDGLDRAWTPRRRRGRAVTFGHFAVVATDRGVELDYGVLRDPLVAIDGDGDDVLLGWSYLRFGPMSVPTPSWFVLRRSARLAGAC